MEPWGGDGQRPKGCDEERACVHEGGSKAKPSSRSVVHSGPHIDGGFGGAISNKRRKGSAGPERPSEELRWPYARGAERKENAGEGPCELPEGVGRRGVGSEGADWFGPRTEGT